MTRAMRDRLSTARRRWVQTNRTLIRSRPETRLRDQRRRTESAVEAQERAVRVLLRGKRGRLEALQGQLRALDPLAILQRGYAVLSTEDGSGVVSRVADAPPGSVLHARVADGTFRVKVEDA
jgi:exodeoxyribonuclease VII large subunit